MAYTKEQASELINRQISVVYGLQKLMLQALMQGQEIKQSTVRGYLMYGVGRRLRVLGRAIENIYHEFTPSTSCCIKSEALVDIEINLQAFVMNLYGIFDNWAWAFILRHNLEKEVGGKQKIGLFSKKTTKYLPKVLKDYLSTNTAYDWHRKYLKSFRDSLAHQIPPYIPPAQFSKEDQEHYNLLEKQKFALMETGQWERLDQLELEQSEIGHPSFIFFYALSEDEYSPSLLIHPQLLSDAQLVVEFGNLFLKHWHERT